MAIQAVPASPGDEHAMESNLDGDSQNLQMQRADILPVRKGFRFKMAFFALSVVAFTSALDATILSIALPIIADDLGLTSLQSFWAGIAFLLSSVTLQPIHTTLSDIFGRKPILYVCLIFFFAGTVTVGAAKNSATLIAGRTIQGVGGGGMEALSEIILTDLTTLKERPLYIGILGLVWAFGSILGPLIGGVVSHYSSWRWIAWINLPLLGIAMCLLPPFLKLANDRSSLASKVRRIDFVGILLFLPGLTCFVLAIVWGGVLFPWSAWETILPLIFGSLLLIVFVFYELRHPEPLIPFRLFKNHTTTAALFGAFIHGIMLWGVVYYLPLYFEAVIQHDPLRAAIDGFPLAFTVTPMSIVCALLIDYTRRYKWTIWIGWVLSTVGLGTMVLLGFNTPVGIYSILQLSPGIGMGLLFPALGIPLQAAVSTDDAGVAMGTFVFFRALGSTIGVSIGSTIFSNVFSERLRHLSLPSNFPLTDGNKAINFIHTLRNIQLPVNLRIQILEVYAESFKFIWIVMACLSCIGLFSTLLMEEITLEREDVGRQAFQESNEQ